MANNNNNNNDGDRDHGIESFFEDHRLTFFLIAAGTISLFITIYLLVTIFLYSRDQAREQPREPGNINSIEMVSVAELIPAHKYKKGDGLVGNDNDDKDEDVVCAVCLAEFEEGEELRTLPECFHSFHAPCIDMWLFSHTTCPVCRRDATPSPSPRIGCHVSKRLNTYNMVS
ncbi:RING-H2 finger protein ATL39-like isoform X1 [Cannabis sativa]|uniref:RING-H2 finger protein ATL39-like isoform X1 n=1 Tax=Cannabis sativa TaxID=3483 RepID=UPI0029CA89B9|nr:RING-H2 finger protein ATL39-like isoform X1 [Cannabis sativa]